MGKIKDYTVGTAKSLDKITVSDADTDETKNITISGLATAMDLDTAWTNLTVPVSSAQLLAINDTPIQILPQPGAGLYYEYKATLKYTYGTTAYSVGGGGDLYLTQGGTADCYFARLTITRAYDNASFGTFYGEFVPNAVIELTSASNPTLGNGTIEIEITYRTRTF